MKRRQRDSLAPKPCDFGRVRTSEVESAARGCGGADGDLTDFAAHCLTRLPVLQISTTFTGRLVMIASGVLN